MRISRAFMLVVVIGVMVAATGCGDDDSEIESDGGTDTGEYCGEPIPIAGACDVTDDLTPSDLVLEELPYLCLDQPVDAATICAEQPGVECFFDESIYESGYIFVFSSTEAVTALVTDACLDVPGDIDWVNERIVVGALSDGTCGCPLEQDRLIYNYLSSLQHLELYIWDPCNPWDENDTECDSDTPAGIGLRVPATVNPTTCLYRNPPCAE